MIHIEDLTKKYYTNDGNTLTALQDINLDIKDNEFVAIVGRSGCGKTTLLKLIAGLIIPTKGTIDIDGHSVDIFKPDVGMVFQNHLLLPWLDVVDNILLPIDILRKDRNKYLIIAHELLEMVGLNGCANRLPRELSGGMQQRVAICRAFIHNPKLLLMDEPFGALDAITRADVGAELMRICDVRQNTVVFVTHSITEAIILADKVVIMKSAPGRIDKVIEIDLPRPRIKAMEFTSSFQDYHKEIHNVIFRNSIIK